MPTVTRCFGNTTENDMKAVFSPGSEKVDQIKGIHDVATLLAEPCLTSATPEVVREHGGPLANMITDRVLRIRGIPEDLHPVIDVRVHRLMKGMYPAIPGWHCDGVPRKDYHSQPDYADLKRGVGHFTCILASHSGLSQTEFYSGPDFEMSFSDSIPVWRQLHMKLDQYPVDTKRYGEGRIVYFDCHTPHRATPSMGRGVRLFYRLSYYHNPAIMDVVNAPQHIYLLSEENGW